jgi:hypothetical protein
MRVKFSAQSFLALAVLCFPLSNAVAEKINLDDAYYEKNIAGNCLFSFSNERNVKTKFQFKSKNELIYTTNAYDEFKLRTSFSNGNLIMKTQSNRTITARLDYEGGRSFLQNVKKPITKSEVHVGPCETEWDYYTRLPALPPSSNTASAAPPSAKPEVVKVEKDEIAALEKKLAALKQKSARKEEYQKMRALLDQKLTEVQGQIQMLEQEYKDVLN